MIGWALAAVGLGFWVSNGSQKFIMSIRTWIYDHAPSLICDAMACPACMSFWCGVGVATVGMAIDPRPGWVAVPWAAYGIATIISVLG